MPRLVLVGDLKDTRPLLDLIPDSDYSVTLAPEPETMIDAITAGPQSLILAALNGEVPASLQGPLLGVAWVGWNRFDAPGLTAAAYEHGALAVLPGSLSREGLRSALRTAFARAVHAPATPAKRVAHGPTAHERGSPINLDEHDMLIVEEGIVATTVLHEDGTEVLVGLCGPGQVLVGHPHDSCCLQLRAHTRVRVSAQSWSHGAMTPKFSERLRTRLRQQEAWAAVQARPHLEDRLLGLLAVLAEQFGRPHDEGTLIDVRLTHAQLASAIGATRATVTRLLGRLRRQKLVVSIGENLMERFVVRLLERHSHG